MGKGNMRNKPCTCNSGNKYKDCCYLNNNLGKKHKESINDEKNKAGLNKVNEVRNELKGLEIVSVRQLEHYDNDPDREKYWYKFLCNNQEIDRIFNIKDASDYLLKIRADTVIDHIRLNRVMIQRRNKKGKEWEFNNHFSDQEFDAYLNLLEDKQKMKCKGVARGYVYSNNPNGSLMRSSYGDLIIISESLKLFLFYMNLFFLDFKQEIPTDVRFFSLRIAIRIMLQSEAMDFELDPRGVIPKDIEQINNAYVNQQLQFVIGHEYAHHLLDHLDTNYTQSRTLLNFNYTAKKYTFYTNSQEQELEADSAALLFPNYDEATLEKMVESVLYFFTYLALLEKVEEILDKTVIEDKTHPPAAERMWNIYNKFKHRLSRTRIDESYVQDLIDDIAKYGKLLKEDITENLLDYEVYGSQYLGQWRGKILIDRVDY